MASIDWGEVSISHVPLAAHRDRQEWGCLIYPFSTKGVRKTWYKPAKMHGIRCKSMQMISVATQSFTQVARERAHAVVASVASVCFIAEQHSVPWRNQVTIDAPWYTAGLSTLSVLWRAVQFAWLSRCCQNYKGVKKCNILRRMRGRELHISGVRLNARQPNFGLSIAGRGEKIDQYLRAFA